MFNEKTRVSVTFATFVTVIGAVIAGAFIVATLKSDYEHRIINLEEAIKIERAERKEDIDEINLELEDFTIFKLEYKTDMAEVKTDLKWLRTYWEEKE